MNADPRLWTLPLLLAATPVLAQEMHDPETLDRAIADAYRANPTLEAGRAQLRALDEQIVQAGSPYRLTVGLNLNMQYRQQDQRTMLDQFGTVRSRTMGATISASQILLNGGRTAAQVSAAEATVLAGRERLRETENMILYGVVDAYASVLRDQALVAIQTRSLDSYGRQVDQAVARERGGDLTRTDIAQAQAQREIIRAQLAQAQANLQSSRARFAALVGRNPGRLAPPPPLPGLPNTLETAFQVAEKESPALWQATLAARAGDARIAAQRAERAPIVALTGGYGYASPYSYQLRDAGAQATGGISVTMPLLAGGLIGSRIRAAVAERQQLGFEAETTRRQALTEVQDAWNQAVAAGEQQISGRIATEAAEAALTGVKRGFQEGFRSNFEVLDSEQRLLNAQIVATNARYAGYVAQARLLATLGRLQAGLLETGVAVYDPAANARAVKKQVFGPFDPLLAPIDRASRPDATAKPPAMLPVATAPAIRPAAIAEPPGTLGQAVPVTPAPALPAPSFTELSDAVVTGGSPAAPR
ncbi:TolC family outer membrane protein [Sphingomonadaceae bacterium jetA1]|jgi:outer membrane protein|uniref:TolC family outer membrane protein n=1 Tax=Facivitalis istanbulensis TaxID=3075838 RepID=UPI003476E62A